MNIIPHKGVGKLRFGMSKEEIRKILGVTVEPFMKVEDDKLPIDAFDKLGIHVSYKEPNNCEAIEMMDPCIPTFNNEKLIGESYKKIKKFISNYDKKIDEDGAGFTSFSLGIGIYSPFLEFVEGVIVFEKGYYD